MYSSVLKINNVWQVVLLSLILWSCGQGKGQINDAYGSGTLKPDLVAAVELIENGAYENASQALDEIEGVALSSGNKYALSSVLSNRGWMFQRIEQHDSAVYFYLKSIAVDQELSDTVSLIKHYKDVGRSLRALGQLSSAIGYYEKAKTLAIVKDDSVNIASTSNSLGIVLNSLKEHEKAISYYQLAADIWGRLGMLSTYSIALHNLGSAYSDMDSMDIALKTLKKSLEIKSKLGRRKSMTYTLSSLGSTYITLDSLGKAEEMLNLAYQIRDSLGNRGGIGELLLRFSIIDMEYGRYNKALEKLERSKVIAKDLQKADLLLDVYEEKKKLYKKWNRLAELAEVDELYDIMTDSLYREEKLKVQEAQSAANLQREQQRTELAEQNTRLKELELDAATQKGQFRLALAIIAFMGLTVIAWQLLQIRKRNTILVALNDRIKLITDNAFHSQKNALGLISALLRSKARQAEHEKELAVLRDVEGKIEALGGVAKSLFQRRIEDNTAVAASVQLKGYLEELVDDTFSSVASQAELDLEVADIETTSTEALNVGLITNEAVTNFSKYAEPHGAETLMIRVLKEGSKLLVSFTDDGPGFPKDFDFSTSTGFGMQMMANLVADMDGSISLKREDDLTQIDIEIPLKD